MEAVDGAHFERSARALRWIFFATGIPVGSLVPRLAEIKSALGADNAAYGTAIAIGGAGSMLGSWLGGRVTHRFGSRAVARLGIVLILLTNVMNALAPSVTALAAVAFAYGFSFSTNNIAVGSQAVLTEQGLGRSFLPRLHAYWSLGTMTSSLIASLLAPHTTPLQGLLLGAVVSFGLYEWAARGLLSTEHEDRPGDDPSQLPRHERIPRGAMRFLVIVAIAQTLGLVAEISAGDWSSVLLHQNFHVAVGPNGYGFTAFMLFQMTARWLAVRFIDAHGLQATVRGFGLLGTVGYLACLGAAAAVAPGSSTAALIASCGAYAFLGIAVGAMPAAFTTAAGAIPGLPSARALSASGMVVALASMTGRISLANVAQVIPLPMALAFMGLFIIVSTSMTFVLQPERAEQHAIRREEQVA